MKQILFIIFCLICQIPVWGQAASGSQDSTRTHYVVLESVPKGAADMAWDSIRVEEGEEFYVEMTPRPHYEFKEWQLDGEVVSTEYGFSAVMGDRDLRYRAILVYNPESPEDPEAPVMTHRLEVKSVPEMGGSCNFTSGKLAEGEQLTLYAIPNSGYKFKEWVWGDRHETTDMLDFVMGTKDEVIYVYYDYSPENPGNPDANYWNPATGELIMDDFRPGYLENTVLQIMDYSSVFNIRKMVIAGKFYPIDHGFVNNAYRINELDLKRTYGYRSITKELTGNMYEMSKVILPSCIEEIAASAFENCASLNEVVCYAAVPPVVRADAFKGVPEGAVLRVMGSSVSLYASAEGWKDFVVLPLEEDIFSLEVFLPVDAWDGRYKNMILEVVNVQTQQKMQMVISDRLLYSFNGLLKDQVYRVSVKTAGGQVLGESDNLQVEDKNLYWAFESLVMPQNISIKVLDAAAQDVTGKVQIRWFTEDGTYLQQGNQVNGVLPGIRLKYQITLPEELALAYQQPEESTYEVLERNEVIAVELEPLKKMTVSGRVLDASTQEPLAGAVVSLSQTLNGQYTKTRIETVDAEGNFSAEIFQAPTRLIVSAQNYVNQECPVESENETVVLEPFRMERIAGTVVNTNFTYTSSVAEGEEAVTTPGYADYPNVVYRLYHVTQNREITTFSVQYPKIVLLEKMEEGEVIELTASSKTGAFKPITVSAVVDGNNQVDVELPVVAQGGIHAYVASDYETEITGALYQADGQLLQTYAYNGRQLNIDHLQDGYYYLVSLKKNPFFGAQQHLDNYIQMGLIEGNDYLKHEFQVRTGKIETVSINTLPEPGESKQSYVDEASYFSAGKASVVAGNYLTLKSEIKFKPEFETKIGGVKLVIDLPESCSFVENSVMIGNSLGSYQKEGNKVIIPLLNFRQAVKFCVIPTAGGTYSIPAVAEFNVNRQPAVQQTGNAVFEVENLTIQVPEKTARREVSISGVALPSSQIRVYDNGVLIGQTQSLANGAWSLRTELPDLGDKASHTIHAGVTTEDGLEMVSETKVLEYDTEHIDVSRVDMIFADYQMQFDFLNPSEKRNFYIYPLCGSDFNFLVNFTQNDVERIRDVEVHVLMMNGKSRVLQAAFNEQRNCWMAYDRFEWVDELPVSCRVEYKRTEDGAEGSAQKTADYYRPYLEPIIDPAGYVYEAVSSNRVPGVTASCYYKETTQDEQGNPVETVSLWDARQYAQENPLFTDENGMYRWDVPQGLWQVKFEKEGYQTTYSEWLPVPPPQLEVNIPLTQNTQPAIKQVKAYENGVELEFNKYMMPKDLNEENIYVSRNGVKTPGTLRFLNQENASEGKTESYVSRLRFEPAEPFLTTDEVTLTVSRKVRSYAGLEMLNDYVQSFYIEKEVERIEVTEELQIGYAEEKEIRVSVVPFDAGIGKKIVVKPASSLMLTLSEDTLVLDEGGSATFFVSGQLPGTTQIVYRMMDSEVTDTTRIQIVQAPVLRATVPTASLPSGSEVYRETFVELFKTEEDAVIYYTTDGTSPEDENGSRRVYNRPLLVYDPITIKAVAACPGMENSPVVEFVYTIKTTRLGLNLEKGWNWISHNLDYYLPVSQLEENALRIVGQNEEVILDPELGLTGNLNELNPQKSYKMQMSARTEHILEGAEFNGSREFYLEFGWNWIGFPVNQTLSLDEAFAGNELGREDCLVGQDGFAMYDGEKWVGTLQTMETGKGYQYYSIDHKTISYHTAQVSKAKSQFIKPKNINEAPWTVDKHKYSSVTPVIAVLCDEKGLLPESGYWVGAFCGSECRGIGEWVDGKLMISVYGELGDLIEFKVAVNDSESVYEIKESIYIEGFIVGSLDNPLELYVTKGTTAIQEHEAECKVWPKVFTDRLYVSLPEEHIDQVTLTDTSGRVVLVEKNLKSNTGIQVGHLTKGVYVITVRKGSDYYYKKLMKAGN